MLHATIVIQDEAAGITFLDHPAGRLSVPHLPGALGAAVRLRVRARDVALAVGEPGRLSIRNRLDGTITEIGEVDRLTLEVRLDAGGEPLIARITRAAATALDLKLGQPVVALIKSTAFDRLDEG